jgi:hypothetical protein
MASGGGYEASVMASSQVQASESAQTKGHWHTNSSFILKNAWSSLDLASRGRMKPNLPAVGGAVSVEERRRRVDGVESAAPAAPDQTRKNKPSFR